MERSSDNDLEGLSADEVAAVEDDLKERLRVYLRHVVALAGAYEHVHGDGNRSPKEPFYYSAAVIEVRGEWYLLTAGHNVEKMEAAATRADMKLVACGLDDTYAPERRDNTPIHYFDFVGAPRFCRNTRGVDFGLIHVRQHYRELLKANGIQALTEDYWNPAKVHRCGVFLMVGFPEDSTNSGITFSEGHYVARVKGAPSFILIDRLPVPPPGCASTRYPRFIGQIRPEHDVGDIAGMSGGPIFCFRGHDFEPYFLAAIQSTWIKKKGITFGCPIPLILDLAADFFAGSHLG